MDDGDTQAGSGKGGGKGSGVVAAVFCRPDLRGGACEVFRALLFLLLRRGGCWLGPLSIRGISSGTAPAS
jgi:hypothetical protein